MNRVIQILDEMVKDSVITDYVIGGATALLYYTIPHFVTEDIDVFVYSKAERQSSLIDMGPLYNYLVSKKNARIEGEYVFVAGFPVQLLVPYDEISREAFVNAVQVTSDNVRFKVFSLEYNMAIMIQLGKEKYFERLRILNKHKLFDEGKLTVLLERFQLASSWSALKQKMERIG